MTTMDQPVSATDFARLLDPAVRPDPYPLYARLRSAGPLRLDPMPVVALSSYDDCVAMLRHPMASVDRSLARLPVSQAAMRAMALEDIPSSLEQPSFLFRDPPDHTRLRRLVSKAFTPRVVQRLEPRIATLVDDAFDRAAAAGSLDLVTELAYPLPVTVICEMLGVPLEDEPRFHRWSSLLASTLDPFLALTGSARADIAERLQAAVDLHRYFDQLVESRKAAGPGDDLLWALLAAQDAGDTLSRDELISTCVLLLVAGHETTVNLIGNGTLALLRNTDTLAALRDDPELGTGVVEETLRFDPPVQLMVRIAREAAEIGGARIEAGDIVMMLLAAAQRDPGAFDDPDRFDPHREARHLAFGMGAHFCLGAPLARLEGRLALTRFAQRVRDPFPAADPPPYKENVTLRGLAALPVGFKEIAPRSTPW